jgi:hypothetical protein
MRVHSILSSEHLDWPPSLHEPFKQGAVKREILAFLREDSGWQLLRIANKHKSAPTDRLLDFRVTTHL